LLTAIVCLGATALTVFWVQYLHTGQWLAFFQMQKLWHRTLQWPVFPLTTFSTKVLWLDIAALFISALACFDAAAELFRVVVRGEKARADAATHFSMAYLAIMGFLAVFYSGIWPGQQGTSLMSINRFVFAQPYFIWYACRRSANRRTLLSVLAFVAALAVALLCGGMYKKLPFLPNYTITLCYFAAIAVYMVLWFLALRKQWLKVLLYTTNIVIMTLLFFDFLGYGWVG
jgi:hypothetical protein